MGLLTPPSGADFGAYRSRTVAVRVAAIYLGFGLTWIWLSDLAMLGLGLTDEPGFWAGVLKGTLFVCLSAGLVFGLVRRSIGAITRMVALVRTVTESTTDAVYVKDSDGKYLFFNTAAGHIVGKGPDEVIGTDAAALFDRDSAQRVNAQDRRVLASEQVEMTEEPLTTAGVTRIFQSVKAPYRDVDGQVIGVVGISRDVTDQRRVEAELRASASRLRALVDHATDMILLHAPGGRILDVNRRATEFIGYTREELIGQMPDLFDPGFTDTLRLDVVARLAAGETVVFDAQHRRKDGTEFPVEVRIWSFMEAGQVFAVSIARNMTERKRAEEEARAGATRLKTLADVAPGVLHSYRLRPDGIADFPYASPRAAQLLGLTPTDLAAFAARPDEYIHPDDIGRVGESVAASAQHLTPFQCEYRFRHPSKGEIWIEAHSAPVRESDGSTVWHGFLADITDRKRAEAALLAERDRFETIVATLPGVVFSFRRRPDGSSTIPYASPATETIYGLRPDELATDSAAAFAPIHPDDLGPLLASIDESARSLSLLHTEFRTRDATRAEVWVEGQAVPMREPDGSILWHGYITDITARKRAEMALLWQKRVLERIARGATLPVILHEIVGLVEGLLPGSLCSILQLDPNGRQLRLGAGPSLPAAYNDAIEGVEIGPEVGSCGTAAFRSETVIVEDIATDPLWANYRDLALGYGLRSCWSVPILGGHVSQASGGSGRVLGTFAVYHAEPATPGDRGLEVMNAAADLAGIAIEGKVAEQALRAERDRFNRMVAMAPGVIHTFSVRPNGAISFPFASPGIVEIYGLPPDLLQIDATAAVAVTHPDDQIRMRAACDESSRTMSALECEFQVRHPKKGDIWVECRSMPGREPDGTIQWHGFLTDVTERKRAEQTLRESEERYRRLIAALPTAVFVHSAGKVVFCNPAFVAIMAARGRDDLLGMSPFDLTHPDFHELIRARLAFMRQTGLSAPGVELRLVRLDGRSVPVYTVSLPLFDSEEPAFLVALSDLTERERSTNLLRSVLASVGDAILTIDAAGIIQSANSGAEKMFGYIAMELIGKNINILMLDLHKSEHDSFIERYLRTGVSRVIGTDGREAEGVRKDGTVFPIELRVSEFRMDDGRHFTGVVRDITARKKLEDQFRQAQKMEAIGRLAGGVAHDFNNLLTVIIGYCDLMLMGFSPQEPNRPLVAAVRDAGERAANLTAQLLAFSRKTIVAPKLIDLNTNIRLSEHLLRRLIGEDVILTVDLYPGLSSIKADPGQIEQVIVNLAVNARDAMPTGGRLTFKTVNVTLTECLSTDDGDLPLGPYVQMTVADTGSGMTESVKSKIFEPFFTTKPVGKGTGLGLAVAYGVIKASYGHISVETELGVGTTFKVLFPAVMGKLPPPASGVLRLASRGTETVILVEDEDAVRRITRIAMEAQGYTVLEANSGAEAIQVASQHAGPIHLVVTDVVMPGMSGPELVEALRSLRPNLKVLYVSGYTDDSVVRYGLTTPTDAFLQKPFTPLALGKKVRDVLEGAG